jgi:hypothetical protein
MGFAMMPAEAGGGGAADAVAVAAASVVSAPVPLGVEGDIVQTTAARRKSAAPRAGSHMGVFGSGRGSS